MTAQSKTTIKSYFETGDRPTQSQFIDFIDSYVDTLSVAGNIAALASAGGTGFVNIISSASASLVTAGAVGLLVLQTATTAAAQQAIGGGTAGRGVFQATTTAAAVAALGASAVGTQVFQAATTAAAQGAIGGGTVGIQIFQAVTTAAVQNLVGGGISLGTFVSAAGTNTVINVPSSCMAVHLGIMNLSSNGTSNFRIQMNNETTGYSGAVSIGSGTLGWTNGVLVTQQVAAAALYGGVVTFRRMVPGTNTWNITGVVGDTNGGGPFVHNNGGTKSLSADLSTLVINTAGSAETFDDGRFNIQCEM